MVLEGARCPRKVFWNRSKSGGVIRGFLEGHGESGAALYATLSRVWTTFDAVDLVTGHPRQHAGLSRRTLCYEQWGEGMSAKVVWHIVREFAKKAGINPLAPHDLRRTCARLCHSAGGELEQIQFLLGHVSIQTTERYLGCKQRIRSAVNDRIGLEPKT